MCDYAVKVYSSGYTIARAFVLQRRTFSFHAKIIPRCRFFFFFLRFAKMTIFFSRDTRARSIIFSVPCVGDVISGTGFVRADTCSSRSNRTRPSRSHVALGYERFVVNAVSQFVIMPLLALQHFLQKPLTKIFFYKKKFNFLICQTSNVEHYIITVSFKIIIAHYVHIVIVLSSKVYNFMTNVSQ